MSRNKSSLLQNLEFCVIDLETTGSFPNKDRIIDIGLVKVSGYDIGETKNFLVNPKMKIPHFVQRLTKIKQRDVENAPTIDKVIDEVVEFIGDSVLVAHNISFDIPFLNGVLDRLGMPKLSNKTLCTNVMTKNLVPEMISSNLAYLNQIFELPHHKAHRALADAVMTADLLVFYLRFFTKRHITKANQLYYPTNKYEFHKRSFSKNQEDELSQVVLSMANGVVTFIDSDSKILYSLPISSKDSSFRVFETKSQELNWERVKIQLTSHHFESLQIIKSHFFKFNKETRDELLYSMKRQYQDSDQAELIPYNYMISPHMIDGQFELYLNFISKQKNKLLFKYPKHQKKLINQMRKLSTLKKRPLKSSDFDEIIDLYLNSNKKDFLFLTDKDITDNPENTWKKISAFLEKKKIELKEKKLPFPIKQL